MTNEQIILNESIKLMNMGIIGTTGRVIEIKLEDGSKESIQEPEPLHTYAGWKSIGYQVRKGEQSVADFKIWKHIPAGKRIDQTTKEEYVTEENMFLTKAFWFRYSQVEPI